MCVVGERDVYSDKIGGLNKSKGDSKREEKGILGDDELTRQERNSICWAYVMKCHLRQTTMTLLRAFA